MSAFAMLKNYKKAKEADNEVKALAKAVAEASKSGLMVIGDSSDYGNHKMYDGDKFTIEFVGEDASMGFYQVNMFGMPPQANGRFTPNQIFKTEQEAEDFAAQYGRPNPTLQVAFLVYVHNYVPSGRETKFRTESVGKLTKGGKTYKTLEEVVAEKQGKLAVLKTSAKYGTQIEKASERYKGLNGRVFEWSRTGATKDDTTYALDFIPSDCYEEDKISPISDMTKKAQKELTTVIESVDIANEMFSEDFEKLRDSVIKKESKNFVKHLSDRVAKETSEASNWGS